MWLDPSTALQTVMLYEELPIPPTPPTPPGAKGSKGGANGGGGTGGGGKLSRTPLQRLTIEAVPRGVVEKLKREGKP